jgi:hypothetical protein
MAARSTSLDILQREHRILKPAKATVDGLVDGRRWIDNRLTVGPHSLISAFAEQLVGLFSRLALRSAALPKHAAVFPHFDERRRAPPRNPRSGVVFTLPARALRIAAHQFLWNTDHAGFERGQRQYEGDSGFFQAL